MTEATPGRVLVAGDWHGNKDFARLCFERAEAEGATALLQLGDFGLWPGREDDWLDHNARLAERTGVELVWVDGNHENHEALAGWMQSRLDGRPLTMRPGVRWAWRGARWEWGGVRFGALGGAVSIDRFLRRPGHNWWPGEVPTPADLDRLGAEPLDILATHDIPALATTPPGRRIPLPRQVLDDARSVRELLDRAVEATRPRMVLHGHHHVRRRVTVGGITVEGLAHDKSEGTDGYAVLELADLLVGAAGPDSAVRLRTPSDPGRPPPTTAP